jgi:hypothetical protein
MSKYTYFKKKPSVRVEDSPWLYRVYPNGTFDTLFCDGWVHFNNPFPFTNVTVQPITEEEAFLELI